MNDLNVSNGPPKRKVAAYLSTIIKTFNTIALNASMVAILFTSVILTYSVISRYFFKFPTDWQDELSVFLLIGIIFLCTAYVQSLRGHIGIDALSAVLSTRMNALRQFVVDIASFLFCAFFSLKSWDMVYEAFVENQTTSTTFAPPLWIPYSMIAVGMSMLSLQIFLQILAYFFINIKDKTHL